MGCFGDAGMRSVISGLNWEDSRSGFRVRTARHATESPVRSLNLDREEDVGDCTLNLYTAMESPRRTRRCLGICRRARARQSFQLQPIQKIDTTYSSKILIQKPSQRRRLHLRPRKDHRSGSSNRQNTMLDSRPSHETEMCLETPCRCWRLACAGD